MKMAKILSKSPNRDYHIDLIVAFILWSLVMTVSYFVGQNTQAKAELVGGCDYSAIFTCGLGKEKDEIIATYAHRI